METAGYDQRFAKVLVGYWAPDCPISVFLLLLGWVVLRCCGDYCRCSVAACGVFSCEERACAWGLDKGWNVLGWFGDCGYFFGGTEWLVGLGWVL